MHSWLHPIASLLLRVCIAWLRVLGTSWGGIVAQVLILLLTEGQGGWWRLQTWKTNWKGGLRRGVYALLAVWAAAFVFCTGATISQDHKYLLGRLQHTLGESRALQRQVAILKSQLDQENNEIRGLRRRMVHAPARPKPGRKSQLAQELRTVASDLFVFQGQRRRQEPAVILSTLPGGAELTRKSFEDGAAYQSKTVIDFLKGFGGRIDNLYQELRPYGLDLSPLQNHVAEVSSLTMITLVASDLDALADQLDAKK